MKDLYVACLKKTNHWKTYADIRFHDTFGRYINWESPRDLNEWINYFSFCTDTSLWVTCADKFAVRDYVKSKGLENILVPLLGKWNQVDDIDFSTLPNEFVMKTNNGSYDAIIVTDKNKIRVEDIREKMRQALAAKFGYDSGEIHYLKMQPCIIAEQLLHPDSEHGIIDYKIWCFYGKPCGILVCFDRDNSHHKVLLDFYSLEWERQQNKLSEAYRHHVTLPKPIGLEKMIDYAQKLSEWIPQVRVDFYDINGTIYFGEMTFTSCQGRMNYFTPEALVELGQKLKNEKESYETKK